MNRKIDSLTKNIDKLWISAQRGFDPNDIRFSHIGLIRRDAINYLTFEKTDSREYTIFPNHEVYLDYELLGGWNGNGYMNTFHGYNSSAYSAFKKGLSGDEPPKDPMDLTFIEALQLYGQKYRDILAEHKSQKEAYDLGLKMLTKFPDFLKL